MLVARDGYTPKSVEVLVEPNTANTYWIKLSTVMVEAPSLQPILTNIAIVVVVASVVILLIWKYAKEGITGIDNR